MRHAPLGLVILLVAGTAQVEDFTERIDVITTSAQKSWDAPIRSPVPPGQWLMSLGRGLNASFSQKPPVLSAVESPRILTTDDARSKAPDCMAGREESIANGLPNPPVLLLAERPRGDGIDKIIPGCRPGVASVRLCAGSDGEGWFSPPEGRLIRPRSPCLHDFAGAVNPPGGPLWTELGVGWGRQDFPWTTIEPRNDEWHFDATDRMVLEAHRWGLEILPILDYFVDWAVERPAEGTLKLRNVGDWEDFVEAVVARYSRPPFNLRYFQVWNEPTRKAGFWPGASDDEFFTEIYLPAARIIRRYGCQVVFGGWPCSDGVEKFAEMLEKHQAWRWTDILDIHYYSLGDMVTLYDRFIRTGRCRGIWQTEVGYHPFPEYLPNLYCRTLYWGLKQGWEFPDQFKLFWYAFWGAGPDAPLCLTHPGEAGNVPSATHGVRMKTLNRVLGGGRLAAFDDYQTEPPLGFSTDEEAEAVEGFHCGDRLVIAFQISPQTQAAHPSLAVRLRVPQPPQVVTRWSATGQTRPLQSDWADGVTTVHIPLDDLEAGVARGWGREVKYVVGYVVVE